MLVRVLPALVRLRQDYQEFKVFLPTECAQGQPELHIISEKAKPFRKRDGSELKIKASE